jgi:aldehyde dehydrogenase (NAD+)
VGTKAERTGSELIARLRGSFDAGLTRPLEWRREQLRALQRILREHERDFLEAMKEDLGRAPSESWATDIWFVANQVGFILRHLAEWVRPHRAGVPLVLMPATARVVDEPLGVALVIAPWNYPLQLTLLPMASAVAAGNCVIGKPSEVAPRSAEAMARLVPRYLDSRCVQIIEGGVPETQALLAERFDHIFYTGNERVGRIVMEAATRHLTPVTLELGGKSPAIVDADADLMSAARRIAFGKFITAGQTCVAPDYVLVHRAVERKLLDALGNAIRSFYGPDPRRSPDYGRIVNDQHFRRLRGLLEAGGYAEAVVGGQMEESERYFAPTVLRGVSRHAGVMQEEIFGPILPVLAVDDVDEAIGFVNARPKPLALYVFSSSDATVRRVLNRTSSGGACVNTAVVHAAVPGLPFGGVGGSGMGAYHGRAGFETFSHRRAVLTKPPHPDPSLGYPPYTKLKQRVLRWALQ